MRGQGTIFATGARTPIGLDSVTTAFSLRTGLPALAASPLATPDGGAVTMGFDATQDPFSVGEERAAALAAAALREVARALPDPRSLNLRVALAFPEPRPGQARSEVGRTLAIQLRAALRETFGDPEVELSTTGPAGLASVLPDALTALATRQIDAVLAGGVHSDYDPTEIAALAALGRLFSAERVDALIPGECAAFVLIAREDFGHTRGLAPLAKIHAVACEDSELTPYSDASALDATALSVVIERAMSVLPDELKVGWAISDHGVEHFRVREVYSALTRTQERWCPPIMIDSPPQRIGRTGAAGLPLGLTLAAEMFRRGFAPTPFGMLIAGSDGGERGAILVGAP